jgi:hypothetical protein
LRSLALCAAALAAALTALCALAAPATAPARGAAPLAPGDRYLLSHIAAKRQKTWHWQKVMGKRPTPTMLSETRSRSRRYRHWVLDLWTKRAVRARKQATNPPRRAAWLCIQRFEGPWDDPNAPYYGGLQMDLTFQRLYGSYLLRRKGTADRWSPLEQMWVAERAYRSGRGFYPWPNTARFCGLI